MAFVMQKCSGVDWTKTALEYGFLSYDFENGKIFDLDEKIAPPGKRSRDASATSTSVCLPASPVLSQGGLSPGSLKSVKRDHGEYRGLQSCCNEATREVYDDDVGLQELLM